MRLTHRITPMFSHNNYFQRIRFSSLCPFMSVFVSLTLTVTPLYICLIYQSLLDCQQPSASVPPTSPQLRRGRASTGYR